MVEGMEDRDYAKLDTLFTNYPGLITSLDKDCENPLIKSIRFWDPKLVGLAMKHGSNPASEHECPHEYKSKNAFLVAAEVLLKKSGSEPDQSKAFERHYHIYQNILAEMEGNTPFTKSGNI